MRLQLLGDPDVMRQLRTVCACIASSFLANTNSKPNAHMYLGATRSRRRSGERPRALRGPPPTDEGAKRRRGIRTAARNRTSECQSVRHRGAAADRRVDSGAGGHGKHAARDRVLAGEFWTSNDVVVRGVHILSSRRPGADNSKHPSGGKRSICEGICR